MMNKLRVSYSKLTFNFHFMLDQTSLATLFLFFYSCLGLNRTSFYKYHQSACQKEHVAFCNIFMSVEVRIHHHVTESGLMMKELRNDTHMIWANLR